MKVVELQHSTMLLAGSLGDPANYSSGGDPFSAPSVAPSGSLNDPDNYSGGGNPFSDPSEN